MSLRNRCVLLVASALLSTLAACRAPMSADGGTTTAASGKDDDGKSEPADKQRALVEARETLASTKSEQVNAVADAEAELASAQRELATAAQVLRDMQQQGAHELVEATIERDEARYRAEESKAELAELEAMYRADEFAAMTKELVLQRGRRALEIAERRLAARQTKLDLLRDVEQAHERREQEDKVEAARAAVAKAERALAQAKVHARLEVLKAEHGLAKATAEAAAGTDS